MKILATDIPILWKNFLSGGTRSYDRLAAEFRTSQPELFNLLKQVDTEWFSAKSDHVVAYGVFIWTTLKATYGDRESIPKSRIEQFQQEQTAFFASIADESDHTINEAIAQRRRNFPEPALAFHIESEFQEGSARATELNPSNNLVAINALVLVIEALVLAPARSKTSQ